MSKVLKGVQGKIVIESMDKSTSEIQGVLTLINNTNKIKHLKDCVLDTYVISEGVRPLLLHSYIIDINKCIEGKESIDVNLKLDGLILSTLASEVIDLDIKLRGTDTKVALSINRTEYIDYIEEEFKKYGFELSGYAVDVKNKMMAKLFRQYYVYTRDTEEGAEKIKVTYTPYNNYIRMCVYHNENKTRTNLEFRDIKSTTMINSKIRDIFKEHKIICSEDFA